MRFAAKLARCLALQFTILKLKTLHDEAEGATHRLITTQTEQEIIKLQGNGSAGNSNPYRPPWCDGIDFSMVRVYVTIFKELKFSAYAIE